MTAAIARSARPRAAALWRVPAVIATYHVAYGIGSIVGAVDVVRRAPGESLLDADAMSDPAERPGDEASPMRCATGTRAAPRTTTATA